MRLDLYLFKNGFAESRQKAKGLLEQGLVTVNGKAVSKSSFDVAETDDVKLTGVGLRYVGRGGLKMEGALKAFSFDPTDRIAIDVGASTGGFTDCLLQHGARKVYAVDAGSDQLHQKLRGDARVVCIENFNAKNLSGKVIPEPISLAVMDLSFISQVSVYPALVSVLEMGADVITLVKPQFEAGKAAVGKNGIVRDKKIHQNVLEQIIAGAQLYELYCKEIAVSPITGGDGNVEYLAHFVYGVKVTVPERREIHRIVFGENE